MLMQVLPVVSAGEPTNDMLPRANSHCARGLRCLQQFAYRYSGLHIVSPPDNLNTEQTAKTQERGS
jgi:hypothetical protein